MDLTTQPVGITSALPKIALQFIYKSHLSTCTSHFSSMRNEIDGTWSKKTLGRKLFCNSEGDPVPLSLSISEHVETQNYI